MVEIATQRLILRTPRTTDAERLSGLSSDLDVARMTTRIPHPNSVANILAWLAGSEAGAEQNFVATLNGEIIGVCSFRQDPDPAIGELGYWVGKPYWGRGYATEMARGLIRHVFATTARTALPISHFIDNPASARVIGKCGFKPVGRRSLHCISRGADVVALTYSLTRAEAEAQPWYHAS